MLSSCIISSVQIISYELAIDSIFVLLKLWFFKLASFDP